MKAIRMGILAVTIAMVLPSTVLSQEADWQFELAPLYLWAILIDGDLGVRERTAGVSVDFGDVWDNLEGVFTLRFNGLYRGKFGFVLDYNYLDLGTEVTKQGANLEVDFKSQILNAAAIYRFIDGPHTLDGAAGIRYTNLDARIDLRNIGVRLDGDQDWVDPIVGLRYAYQIADKWTLRLYGDIGGFGVSSDFTWQGLGLIDFQPWKNVAIVAGYRAIGTDYETGSGMDQFSYDATVHGPVLGIDIRW
jgi:hypothetical protein